MLEDVPLALEILDVSFGSDLTSLPLTLQVQCKLHKTS